jgi:hypothetical protein
MGSVTGNRIEKMILTGILLTEIMVFTFDYFMFCNMAKIKKAQH